MPAGGKKPHLVLKSEDLVRIVRVLPKKVQRGDQKNAGVTVAVAMASGATINITTFLESPKYALDRLQLQLVEVFVVIFVLIAWVIAIFLFMRRWHKLRIVPPADASFKSQPKNMDKIRVVKKQTESVIYRNYSRRMSKTIIAREKHLARMNTMPELQVHIGPKDKKLGRLRTMPFIELGRSKSPRIPERIGLHILHSIQSTENKSPTDSSSSSKSSVHEV